MNKIISYILIVTLILQTSIPLFANGMSEDTRAELYNAVSLQEHYQAKVIQHEGKLYNLEAELEVMNADAGSDPDLYRGQIARRAEIQRDIKTLESRISDNRQLLHQTSTQVDNIRSHGFSGPASPDQEKIATSVAAVNASAASSNFGNAVAVVNPTTGLQPHVIGTKNNIVTAIERHADGWHKVNRHASGPNKGRYAKGGRQKLTDAEVTKMGNQLKTSHVNNLQTSIQNNQTKITDLKGQLNGADKAAKKAIKAEIKGHEKIQSELKSELKRSQSSPASRFIKSGVTFAAMSVAVTASYNIVHQIIQNKGDVSKVNFKEAFQFITTAQFWTANAGAFTGSMVGSALTSFLPGPFKILGVIAGGALGYQIGSGQLGSTDWASLGAQVIGSTIGYFVGAFVGAFLGPFAPIAIIVFSILGSILAEKALTWLRSKFTPKVQSGDIMDLRDGSYEDFEEEASRIDGVDYAQIDNMSEVELRDLMWVTYNQYRQSQEMLSANPDAQNIEDLQKLNAVEFAKYTYIKQKLNAKRTSHFAQ
ncbi:MAG: DUF456 domain-containing protein [Candidatus Cloacimonetes bacterium]|nr:DUF456 domain-containing protein [Candidatus Cloacimonadota bacterium]